MFRTFYAYAVQTAVAIGLMALLALPSAVAAQPKVTGHIQWGLWVDADGCMHWWADGGVEGYMVPRRNPKTGKPVCLRQNLCMSESSDVLFESGSARISAKGRERLTKFFKGSDAFGYGIYGFTDNRGNEASNQRLSDQRARAVAQLATSLGMPVERQMGFGARDPVASNATAAGRAQNRRVEIVCYKW